MTEISKDVIQAKEARVMTICHGWQNIITESETLLKSYKGALAGWTTKASIAVGRNEDSQLSEEGIQEIMAKNWEDYKKVTANSPSEFFESLPEVNFPSNLFDTIKDA